MVYYINKIITISSDAGSDGGGDGGSGGGGGGGDVVVLYFGGGTSLGFGATCGFERHLNHECSIHSVAVILVL